LTFGFGNAAVRQEMALANPAKRKMPYAPAIAIGTLISFFAR
jgi:prepilin peptidase CpaA